MIARPIPAQRDSKVFAVFGDQDDLELVSGVKMVSQLNVLHTVYYFYHCLCEVPSP